MARLVLAGLGSALVLGVNKSRRRMAAECHHKPNECTDTNHEVLYHYTDTVGKGAIQKRGCIPMSTPDRDPKNRDARLDSGVYLTSLGPWEGSEALALNNYDGGLPLTEEQRRKTEWYFRFEANSSDLKGVERVTDIGKLSIAKRQVFLIHDRDLPITTASVNRRAVW